MEQKIRDLERLNQENESQISSMPAEIEKLGKEMALKAKETEELIRENEDKNSTLIILESTVVVLEMEKETLHQDLKKMENDKNATQVLLNKLNEDLERLEKTIEESKTTIEKGIRQIRELEQHSTGTKRPSKALATTPTIKKPLNIQDVHQKMRLESAARLQRLEQESEKWQPLAWRKTHDEAGTKKDEDLEDDNSDYEDDSSVCEYDSSNCEDYSSDNEDDNSDDEEGDDSDSQGTPHPISQKTEDDAKKNENVIRLERENAEKDRMIEVLKKKVEGLTEGRMQMEQKIRDLERLNQENESQISSMPAEIEKLGKEMALKAKETEELIRRTRIRILH
ncbi:flagellar attachment zone protein 1-like [Macrobrachium rosenbergii]|uniref:flagellar attachment zone protein 1-like n=1 Tax=Macrobrachium rosenbergii TaxID=79674 RepID=UPI0034D78184